MSSHKKSIKLFLWTFFGFLLICFIYFITLHDYFSTAVKDPLEFAKEQYDFQIHVKDYNTFYETNSGSIVKVWQPAISSNDFLGILMDTKDKTEIATGIWDQKFKVDPNKKIKVILVYKNINEKWTDFQVDFSKDGKWGFGIFNEDYIKETAKTSAGMITTVLYVIFMWIMIFFFVRMAKGQSLWGMKMEDIVKVKRNIPDWKSAFDLIWGIESQKEELKQIVKDINDWEKFKKAWVRNVRGLLFFGPPGVGKTMIARAIAIDANIEFFSVNAASMRSAFYGQSAKNVKKTIDTVKSFTEKHKNKLWILFIDEIDSLLKSRTKKMWTHWEDESIVNTFLSEMDSIEGGSNVIIIGATNYSPTDLDEAAMSRFDKKLFFNLPNLEERKDIIAKIINNYKNPEGKEIISTNNISVDNFARKMPGGSGRDIETIINEAIRKAISKDTVVTDEIIHNEIASLAIWPENKSHIIPEELFNVITYHELWHAYIWKRNGKIAETVTVIPRWPSLGTAWLLDKKDNVLKRKQEILNDIQELVAWRQAERIFCNTETTWASNDYERAKRIALAYLLVYNFDYPVSENETNRFYAATQQIDSLPQEMQKEVHETAAKIIADQEKIVYDILLEHKEDIEKSFLLLKDKETIGHDDIYIDPIEVK